MHHVVLLIIGSFFSQVAGGAAVPSDERLIDPRQQQERAIEPTYPQPTPSTPFLANPDRQETQRTNANQVSFSNCLAVLPRYNEATLSSIDRAMLLSFSTEQRDTEGNVILGVDGEPVMIPVKLGMRVFKGQELGTFDNREEYSILEIRKAQLEVAKAEQEKQIEVEYAAQGVRMAHIELNVLKAANESFPGSAKQVELDRAVFAIDQANSNLALQKYNLYTVKPKEYDVRDNEMKQTEIQIERRKLISPIDGMIVEVNAAEGELLREGDVVVKVVQFDPMHVRVPVNVSDFGIGELLGKEVSVQFLMPHNVTETFKGKVVVCIPNVDATDKFGAYVEIRNPRDGDFWKLQPGQKGTVTIQL